VIKLNAMTVNKGILLEEVISERGKITLTILTKTSFRVRKCTLRKKEKQTNST